MMAETGQDDQASGSIGIILTASALVLILASNLIDIGRFHTSLEKATAQQETTLVSTRKAEAQLDSLAKGVQALAAAGNPNARAIVDALARSGVQISARDNSGAANPPTG